MKTTLIRHCSLKTTTTAAATPRLIQPQKHSTRTPLLRNSNTTTTTTTQNLNQKQLTKFFSNPTTLQTPILLQLWNQLISLNPPPIHSIESLFTSTIHQSTTQISPNSPFLLNLNRLLSLALGLLIRSLRSYQPLDEDQRNYQTFKLSRWLSQIDVWQQATRSFDSNELNHRRIQIQNLLNHHQPRPSERQELQDTLDHIRSSNDPYLISTLLRNNKHHHLESVLENHRPETPCDHQKFIKAIRVVCRSKGQLIYQAHPDRGPHQILSSDQVKQILQDHPQPSVWRTGLILSYAESLVGQINAILTEEPSSSSLSKAKLEQIMAKLIDLIHLKLADSDLALYGGQVEKSRLLRRQTDGIETFIQHILANSCSNGDGEEEQAFMPDFGLVFDLIEGGLARLGHHVVRTRTWKSVVSSHLKFCSRWDGPAGLARCFSLLTSWSRDFDSELDARSAAPSDCFEPAMLFKKIMPADLGLLMVERVLFPQRPGARDRPEEAGSAWPGDAADGRFEALLARIDAMGRVVESLGSPRRFRDRRLLRLIFLSVRRRRGEPGPAVERRDHQLPPSALAASAPAQAWWDRPDIWRDLQDRLGCLPHLDPPPLHQQQHQHQHQHLHRFPSLETVADQWPVFEPQLEPNLAFDACHQAAPDPAFWAADRAAGSSRHRPSTSATGTAPASRTLRHPPNAPPARPPRASKEHVQDRPRPEGERLAERQGAGIGKSLDAANTHLQTHSRDFFNQHSLLTCLVYLVKHSLTRRAEQTAEPADPAPRPQPAPPGPTSKR